MLTYSGPAGEGSNITPLNSDGNVIPFPEDRPRPPGTGSPIDGPGEIIEFPPPPTGGPHKRCIRILKTDTKCYYECEDGTPHQEKNSCKEPCPSFVFLSDGF